MIISNSAIIQEIQNNNWQEAVHHANTMGKQIEDEVTPIRETIIENTAAGKINIEIANDYLEAIRWLDRVSDHIERIAYHLASEKTG